MAQPGSPRRTRRLARPALNGARALALGALLLLPACAGLVPSSGEPCSEPTVHLEREVARLRAELRQADEAMVTIESGLRGVRTRAEAVSSLAEARIAVERASQRVPWRPADVLEARAKLEEAEQQLEAGHSGSAIFFASRARRIAETLSEEADQVSRHASTRFVRGRQVNLRAGPSTNTPVIRVLSEAALVFPQRRKGNWVLVRTTAGPVGWVHGSLLGPSL